MENRDDGAGQIVSDPHDHDVLCGRGGLSNQHTGNEWFRRLVRSNRALYRSCPKHTKLLVAKAIVQAVQQQEPPGRFLEHADKEKLTWRQIPYKRAVDKTSQALREKDQPGERVPATNLMNSEVAQLAAQAAAKKGKKEEADLSDLTQATLRQAGLPANHSKKESARKRKAQGSTAANFVKPSWWRQGMPNITTSMNGIMNPKPMTSMTNPMGNNNKRMRTSFEETAPLPPEPLQVRQSSLFRFLNGSGIFGRNEATQNAPNTAMNNMQSKPIQQQQSAGMFAFSGISNQITQPTRLQPNPSDLITMEAPAFETGNGTTFSMGMQLNQQQSLGLRNLEPLPVNAANGGISMNNLRALQQQTSMFGGTLRNVAPSPNNGIKSNAEGMEEISTTGLFPPGTDQNQALRPLAPPSMAEDAVPPPSNKLTSQVSDWLTSFWPLGKDQQEQPHQQAASSTQEAPAPPPPTGDKLERSISSTLFNLARSPSQFLTNLKSGVTSLFGGDDLMPTPVARTSFVGNNSQNTNAMGGNTFGSLQGSAPVIGTASTRSDSLLDDYEETPLETRLRSVTSR